MSRHRVMHLVSDDISETSAYRVRAGSHETLHALLAPFRMLYKASPCLAHTLALPGFTLIQLLSAWLPIDQHLVSMLAFSITMALIVPVLALASFSTRVSARYMKS